MSDSDEEIIVEFVKQHEELYDKTNDSFKDKQKKRKTLGDTGSYQEFTFQDCEEVVQESMYQICQAHSDKVRTST